MRSDPQNLAAEAIALCREMACLSETEAGTTRRFLSAPMHACHDLLRNRMTALGMEVRVDAAGNLRGVYPSQEFSASRLLIGSHIDTVPNAGAYDGVLGVAIAIALVAALDSRRLGFAVEVVAFSEEEGVRFGVPFIGSRALTGNLHPEDLQIRDENGITMEQAIRDFGLEPQSLKGAGMTDDVVGFLEFHIEQGPVLDAENLSLAVVEAIAGQSRFELIFSGIANHAGTTPMNLRHDPLAAAAEWITAVEQTALATDGLVATVGRLLVHPGAGNVIPGEVRASLDVRSAADDVRMSAVDRLLASAREIARRRRLGIEIRQLIDQPAVAMDAQLIRFASEALGRIGVKPKRMVSGAGHDAMILAKHIPTVMVFLRTPGGLSHHPDETVHAADVEAAIRAGTELLAILDEHYRKARLI